MPDRAFMHIRWNGNQDLANPIEKKPGGKNSKNTQPRPGHSPQPGFLFDGRLMQLPQASGADHTIIMLGNAFAAEKLFTFRATGSGFPGEMIQTMMNEILHLY